jgi:hypothetical protein
MTAKALLAATLLPLTAIADPPAPANNGATDAPVIVMRGSQVQVQGGPQKAVKAGNQAAPPGQQEDVVIVMRPAPGSFLRETTRLASEAEVREERAAQEEAREANMRLTEALQAVEEAANAVQAQPRKTRYLVLAPVDGGGAIDPRTGKFVPKVAGGFVDPETGRFTPRP